MDKGIKIRNVILYAILGLLFISNIFVTVFFFTHYKTEKIFNNNILKVVEIKVSDDEITWGHATGCLISGDGKILTNKHVITNSETDLFYAVIQVRFADSDDYLNAQIVKTSETDDLAIIKIEKVNCKYFKFASKILNGETIFTIGNPNGFGLSFASGVISSGMREVIYNGQTIEAVQTSLVINEGNSGGPIFNRNGNLLGIISFRLKDKNGNVIQGVSFAVPVSHIKAFVNS